MNEKFAETLKKLRTLKSITQRELAEKIFVTRSIIAKWENSYSLPDIFMIERICKVLEVNEHDLIKILLDDDELNVIILDDRKIVVRGSLPVIEEVLPNANIFGFTQPSEAIEFAQKKESRWLFWTLNLAKQTGLTFAKNFWK